jgi:DNA-directed RNA polymerase specialized sigma24 family protein
MNGGHKIRRRINPPKLAGGAANPSGRASLAPRPRKRGAATGSEPCSEDEHALAELPRPYREAVAAVDVAGLSYAEAARALGVRQGTIMSRVYRGREQVARAVGTG